MPAATRILCILGHVHEGKPEVCLTCIQLMDVAAFPWSSVLAESMLSDPAPAERLPVLHVLLSAYSTACEPVAEP